MTASAPRFSHTDSGTEESVWWGDPRWDNVPTLDLAAIAALYSHVLVASAHPDDETLGVGGLLTDLADLGVSITILVATAGERCQPRLTATEREAMAARRRREVEQAVGGLAAQAQVIYLGLPDSDLPSHEGQLADEIAARSYANTLVLAPWTGDGHKDHDALGRAAIAASAATRAATVHFPLWLWHWGTPDTLPWEHLVVSETSLVGCWRKRAAVAAFNSQLFPTRSGPGADLAPILGPAMQARARRLVEVVIDEHHLLPRLSRGDRIRQHQTLTDRFDEMYDDGPDPWNNLASFYEQRRRALITAMLGSARYRRVLELGCADGFLTSALVARADEVHSFDTSARAISAARANAPAATVHQGDLPSAITEAHGEFDLIVLSEVGYFLTAIELLATLRRARSVLAPGGELLLCHWQHPTNRVPLDGVLVHEQARDFMGVKPRARHHDGDLCIEIWGDGPSVAALEGRI